MTSTLNAADPNTPQQPEYQPDPPGLPDQPQQPEYQPDQPDIPPVTQPEMRA